MKKSQLLGAVCACVIYFVTLPVNAAFIGRLPATLGGTDYQAYYDTQLDITWTADANINDTDTWNNQVAWAAGLNIDGIGGWRLPNMERDGDLTIVDCSSATQAACMDNEYGHLFYYGAGMTMGSGVTAASPSPFSNVQADFYWSSNVVDAGSNIILEVFSFGSGTQGGNNSLSSLSAWAVQDGDVGAVPVPAAAWLFGSGLIGLIGVARRKKAA